MNVQYIEAWKYFRDHAGTRLLSIAAFLVAYFQGGGHLPSTAEGWTYFAALVILSAYGLVKSQAGASTVALKGGN